LQSLEQPGRSKAGTEQLPLSADRE
jgi:hypothetical protein